MLRWLLVSVVLAVGFINTVEAQCPRLKGKYLCGTMPFHLEIEEFWDDEWLEYSVFSYDSSSLRPNNAFSLSFSLFVDHNRNPLDGQAVSCSDQGNTVRFDVTDPGSPLEYIKLIHAFHSSDLIYVPVFKDRRHTNRFVCTLVYDQKLMPILDQENKMNGKTFFPSHNKKENQSK